MNDVILEMRGITKTFPGVNALDNVNLAVRARRDPRDRRRERRRQVDADEGAERRLSARQLRRARSSSRARRAASAASPTARRSASSSSTRSWRWCRCCRSPRTSSSATRPPRGGVIDWFAAYARTRELLAKVGLNEPPDTLVTNLGVGKQQLVEIAKALSKEVKLLILDEPTASLNESDSDALLRPAAGAEGAGHRLDPDLAQAQRDRQGRRLDHRAARRRHGRDASTAAASAVSEDRIIRGMVGRDMAHRYPQRTPKIGETDVRGRATGTCTTRSMPTAQVIKGVDLHVRRGEIVGIAGLMGAGRTEFAMSVFGRSYGQRISGTVRMHGQEVDVGTIEPRDRRTASPTSPRTARASAWCSSEDIRKNISAGQPGGGVGARRDRRRPRVQGRQRLPARAAHPLLGRVPEGRSTCRAATSRRWCWRSGSSPSPSC